MPEDKNEAAQKLEELKEKIKRVGSLRLSNPKERTEKKILRRQICDMIFSLYDLLSGNQELLSSIPEIPREIFSQMNTELRWLQKRATDYFTEKFDQEGKKIQRITFLSKIDGVQQGNRMCIDYLDPEGNTHQIMYYIKTHQHGSLRSGGSTTTSVDFKEPLIYRALEYAGFGPKAFFFFNPFSPSAFYIATQDEAFTKDVGKKKIYQTCGQAGALFKKQIAEGKVKEVTKRGVATAEILRRILSLWDITSNTGNYGFSSAPEVREEKWRVIDFRVNTAKPEESYEVESVYGDFIDRKGMVGYVGLAAFVLSDVQSVERVRLANLTIDALDQGRLRYGSGDRKMKLCDAIQKAHGDMKAYIGDHGKTLGVDSEKVLLDLGRYCEAVQKNLASFIEAGAHHVKHEEESPAAGSAGPAAG